MKIAFVLRGRPGLGHVIPGLSLAVALADRGHDVLAISYANAIPFLQSQDKVRWIAVDVAAEYIDWPGLDLYDDGLRSVWKLLSSFSPDLVVLGGEYLLPALASIVDARFAMIFNPEIMEDNERNAIPSRLFCSLFDDCDILIPMHQLGDGPYIQAFQRLKDMLAPPGPFLLPRPASENGARGGITILVGNGGGVDFPKRLTSYSDAVVDPDAWLTQTFEFTQVAIEAAARAAGPDDRIAVFSCLPPSLQERLQHPWQLDARVQIQACSSDFYRTMSESSVVISRAGLGFLSDLQFSQSHAVIWALKGHNEQIANALHLAAVRPHTSVCQDASGLHDTCVRAVHDARDRAANGAPLGAEPAHERALIAANYIESVLQ